MYQWIKQLSNPNLNLKYFSYSSAVAENLINQNKVFMYISQRRYFYEPKDKRKEYYGRKLVG